MNRSLFVIFFLFLASVYLYSRGRTEDIDTPVLPPAEGGREVVYAEGFQIERRDGWTLLRVTRPWPQAAEELTYALYPRGTQPPETDCSLLVEVPVERIIVFSTSNLASLEVLGETEALAGIDNRGYVYSARVLDMVDQGSVVQVGEHPNLDMETILTAEPDIIMTPVYGPQGAFGDLRRAGLPVVVNGDWLETTALGRAEWIRFIAAFFGKDTEAAEYMNEIARAYNELAAMVSNLEVKPSVMLNTPWQGTWYMPAGESYQSLLLEDAGAEYPWADTPGTGSLVLDFEEVYSMAGGADIWLHTGFLRSREEALKDDPRFAAFKSFAEGSVYNNDARLRSSGASDFWESASITPHLVLEDLVRIIHPGLLPDGPLHYYRKLE